MKIEYGYKAEKIKEIKKDIKKSMKELKYKQEMMQFMTEEYDKTPKDVNRNQYLKRINEINNQVKSSMTTIQLTLEDVTKVQEESERAVKEIAQLDTEVESLLYKAAEKDKPSQAVYQKFQQLKGVFAKLIDNVQLSAKIQL